MSDKLTLPIQMFDPKRDYQNYKKEYDTAIQTVLDHGLFINGPEVKQLESKLAEYVDVKHCVCVANGTDALQITLLALGIGVGDEVITVAHTWISTAEVISLVNAKPVFVDIEDKLFCMDPNLLEAKITGKTKAIIVVNLYGQMPDYDLINKIAGKYNLPVIEDGAQSFGATYKGRRSCGLTTIGTTSFFPSKPLGCYGDGGACFTSDPDLAGQIRAISNHGGVERIKHTYRGMNSRLDSLQAAVLLVKFQRFTQSLVDRNKVADCYYNSLNALEYQGLITLPRTESHNTHVWAQYTILVRSKSVRDKIFDKLKELGVNVAIFYPVPLHTQKCFESVGCADDTLSVTDRVCDRIINLPCYSELTSYEQEFICNKFTELVSSINE